MAKTTRGRFSDTGFDLFVIPAGQTVSGNPLRIATILTVVSLLTVGAMTLLILRFGDATNSTTWLLLGGGLIGHAFINPTYRLYAGTSASLNSPGLGVAHRFRNVRAAGAIYLIGALATGFANTRFLPIFGAMWLGVAAFYGLRIAAIGRELASAEHGAELEFDRVRP